LLAIHHRDFEMACGEMTEAEFTAFLGCALRLLSKYSTSGSVQFLCMDWRHMSELLAAGGEVYDSLLNLCVWVKDNGGMGSFYRSRHELVFVFRNGKGSHRNNVQLGRFGRNRTNVWEYAGVMDRQHAISVIRTHPTAQAFTGPIQMAKPSAYRTDFRGDRAASGACSCRLVRSASLALV
jgi:hypothetical protein